MTNLTSRPRRCSPWLVVPLLILAAVASCAHSLPANAIELRVECNVPDATVWIDDVLMGTTKDWSDKGRYIKPGFHRIEVRHPGYYSFFQEVELPPGSQTVVRATLRELVE